MYILCPRIQKTLFDGGSVRRHKLGIRSADPVCGPHTRTIKTIKTIFFNKNQFLQCFSVSEKGRTEGADWGGWGGLGSSSKKAPLLSFVSVWENRIRNRLATVPVCDDGHFLHRKVSFGSGCSRSTGEGGYEMGISRANASRNPWNSLRSHSKSTVGLLKLRLQCVIGLHIVRITHCKALYKKRKHFFSLGLWGGTRLSVWPDPVCSTSNQSSDR